MQFKNQLHLTADQAKAFFEAPEDGPFVMVNLLKFKPKAEYADGSDADISGFEAYGRYGRKVRHLILKVGGTPGYAGPVTGLRLGEVEELWDMVALAGYPSLAAMKEMVESPDYRELAKHRDAGLAGQLNIKTKGSLAG
ncbi:MAG: DUF1330 domain-containing protein [Aquabacterium sp.]|nr:DUF1330 domain-containing protein [Aquabacterium sp.]